VSSFEYFYGDYGQVEQAFLQAIDTSLNPRGPDMLYDIVADLPLEQGARVLDLGCGDGTYSIELARRFGFSVLGVDPYQEPVAAADSVSFHKARAEDLPVADASIDLIWCRDMLVHIDDLAAVFNECRRVLRSGGSMLILHSLATDRLSADEAAFLWPTMHVVPATTDRATFEAALAGASFETRLRIDVGSEWREYREETSGQSRLLHAARMLRRPDRYIAKFGQQEYDIMLGDCYWHIYQLLGKLSYSIYVVLAA
jgi:SAM-dependent methyltransferase